MSLTQPDRAYLLILETSNTPILPPRGLRCPPSGEKLLYLRHYNHYYKLVLYKNKALTESGERYWCGKKATAGASVSKKTICKDSIAHYTLQNDELTGRQGGQNPRSVRWRTGTQQCEKNRDYPSIVSQRDSEALESPAVFRRAGMIGTFYADRVVRIPKGCRRWPGWAAWRHKCQSRQWVHMFTAWMRRWQG